MKKITLITSYYYPEDTAVGLYNLQMIEYLEDKGYEVNVITGFPNYPQWKIRDSYKNKSTFFYEKINKTHVFRYKQYVPPIPTFLKRILLIIDFTLGSLINVLKVKDCDIVISVVPYTSTVFLGWILKLKTKAKFWVHVQDFEFDAAEQAGISSGKSKLKNVIFNILYKIESRLLNLADVNSTISYKMIEKLEKKSHKPIFYFPNWIDGNKINPSTLISNHDFLKSPNFKILYSGNIGEKQDWEFFLLFANAIKDDNIDIILVGDGAKKHWLLDKIKHLKQVKYYEPIPYKDLSDLLCSTDMHILFQKNDVVDSVMPSKLLGMMASAKPSLITGSSESEVKKIIMQSGGGFYLESENLEDCVSIVKDLINDSARAKQIGENARNYIVKEFSLEEILMKFEKKLSQI